MCVFYSLNPYNLSIRNAMLSYIFTDEKKLRGSVIKNLLCYQSSSSRLGSTVKQGPSESKTHTLTFLVTWPLPAGLIYIRSSFHFSKNLTIKSHSVFPFKVSLMELPK